MTQVSIDGKAFGEALKRELDIVMSTLREKGSRRFQKAFLLSGAMAAAAYFLVYRPPVRKAEFLEAEIEAAKTRAEHGGRYKALIDQLTDSYRKLPAEADREQWLSNSVRDSLSAEGLVTEDFKPVRESEQSGLVFQVSMVSMNVRFDEFYKWILRVESAQPLMHVQTIELAKRAEILGGNSAIAEVATVVPKKRYR